MEEETADGAVGKEATLAAATLAQMLLLERISPTSAALPVMDSPASLPTACSEHSTLESATTGTLVPALACPQGTTEFWRCNDKSNPEILCKKSLNNANKIQ